MSLAIGRFLLCAQCYSTTCIILPMQLRISPNWINFNPIKVSINLSDNPLRISPNWINFNQMKVSINLSDNPVRTPEGGGGGNHSLNAFLRPLCFC